MPFECFLPKYAESLYDLQILPLEDQFHFRSPSTECRWLRGLGSNQHQVLLQVYLPKLLALDVSWSMSRSVLFQACHHNLYLAPSAVQSVKYQIDRPGRSNSWFSLPSSGEASVCGL